jgi:hypothetical protein
MGNNSGVGYLHTRYINVGIILHFSIMKEVIMKKLLFWLALIVGTVALLGSCAKKEESTTAAAAVPAGGSGSTASGTVTGIDGLTGIFDMSWLGDEPSGGCISNSTAVAAMKALSAVPSDTSSFKKQMIISSSTTFTESIQYYSDASCATITGYTNSGKKNISVGDSLSGLGGSSPTKPTTAKKVSWNDDFLALKSNTDSTTTWFNSVFGASSLSTLGFAQGTELKVTNDPDTNVSIWETGTLSGSSKTYLFTERDSASTYPDNWTSNASVWWQE